MNAGIAIILFFSVAVIYIIIIDIFTLLYRIMGLTLQQARFQVISLLTNSGYTTEEAEIIVKVPPRRKLARAIMLFGYIFSVTIMSLFVNVVMTLPQHEAHEVWPFILGTCGGFFAFMVIKRIPKVRRYFDDKIITAAEKRLNEENTNRVILLDEFTDASLAKVVLNNVPDSLKNKPVSKLDLQNKGIHPLFYKKEGEPIHIVDEDTIITPKVSLTVVGPLKKVKEVFINTFNEDLNENTNASNSSDTLEDSKDNKEDKTAKSNENKENK